jgi:ribosomal protein S18 acetylase RimI-like enzyme
MTGAVVDSAPETSIQIVGYRDEYVAAFARLNREWLEQYALLEECDRKHLEHPRETILATGGEIFFALREGNVVGTCATIVRDGETVELAKLAVDPAARGHGIGQKLTEAAIAWSRRRGARSIVLVSSSKLQAALRLYQRLGFQHRPLPPNPGYASADVFMELHTP